MKLQKILLLVGFFIAQQNQAVAAQGSELDSASSVIKTGQLTRKKVCKDTYGCQAYLSIVDQYQKATGDKTLFRAPNEVKNLATVGIIQSFVAEKVSYPFMNQHGNTIIATLNEKSGKMGLSHIKNDRRFLIAQTVLKMFQGRQISQDELCQGYDILEQRILPDEVSCMMCAHQRVVTPIE